MSTLSTETFCLQEQKTYQSVLRSFIKNNEFNKSYHLHSIKNSNGIKIITFILESQKWPIKPDNNIETTIWKHKIHLYVPSEILHKTALLYVSGGINYSKERKEEFLSSKEKLDFEKLAEDNKAVVAVIEDVPNQYLFIDGEPKKEDDILAFTYKKIIEDPDQYAELAGHLPMAKSIIAGMNFTIEILQERNITIENFVLVGASKRGWAVWLASLEDSRVSAIVPIVIDILNVQNNIEHICRSYIKGCPLALDSYKQYSVLELLMTNASKPLLEIEDPYSYLKLPEYQAQASIPKYIINAAGDDFFAPDSAKFYFPELTGEKYLRYLPKAMHYFSGSAITDYLNNAAIINKAIDNYFYFHLNNIELPQISWSFTDNKVTVNSSIIPKEVHLWTAHNDNERDFRFINNYKYWHLLYKAFIANTGVDYLFHNLCDNCYYEEEIIFSCPPQQECVIEASLESFSKGWRASFLELHYEIEEREFVATTQINIFPDTYPE